MPEKYNETPQKCMMNDHVIRNKSNSMAGAKQVEANLQEQFNDYLHFRKQNFAKTPGT